MNRQQKHIRSADSPSLWNCTLSPGWNREDVAILRKAVMKFGLGAWTKIVKSNCLPGKNPSQLNLQTQRLLGQQSLGVRFELTSEGFMGIHLDPDRVFADNAAKKGPDVIRKNGCLINTGNNPNKEERERLIEENRAKYGLTQEEIDAVELPVREPDPLDVLSVLFHSQQLLKSEKQEKRDKLKRLKMTLHYMEQRYEQTFKKEIVLPKNPTEPMRAKARKALAKKKGRKGREEEEELEMDLSDEEEDDFVELESDEEDYGYSKKKRSPASKRKRTA